jgi:hypothetical protein
MSNMALAPLIWRHKTSALPSPSKSRTAAMDHLASTPWRIPAGCHAEAIHEPEGVDEEPGSSGVAQRTASWRRWTGKYRMTVTADSAPGATGARGVLGRSRTASHPRWWQRPRIALAVIVAIAESVDR